jgi:hypothetical protein
MGAVRRQHGGNDAQPRGALAEGESSDYVTTFVGWDGDYNAKG